MTDIKDVHINGIRFVKEEMSVSIEATVVGWATVDFAGRRYEAVVFDHVRENSPYDNPTRPGNRVRISLVERAKKEQKNET